MVSNIAYRQTTLNGVFHITNEALSKNFFLSADIIFYFCLTCTQTEQFQKGGNITNQRNVSRHFKTTYQLTRQIKILTISFALTGTLLFSGCAIIGAFVIAKNATCKVKINDKSVKGSCELINGVFFERLAVINKDSIGMPSEYIVTERFACYNPGMDGVQKYWPDEIYFKKPNGHYKWNADTIDIRFKLTGRKREMISIQKKPDNYNEMFILNSKKYDTCPISFQKNTWYNVRIYDQRLTKVLLYVDEKKKFNVYKFDSGICPI